MYVAFLQIQLNSFYRIIDSSPIRNHLNLKIKIMNRIFPFLYLLFIGLSLNACKVKNYSSGATPVQHQQWDSLLQKHVTAEGWVDYDGFIKDSLDLRSYLNLLSENHPDPGTWTNEERMAYWINAYNAFTVDLILRHYPLESIKDIRPGIPFVNTVWDIKFINIQGQTYDLNNIEHGILRPKFDEPRIHFAVNCASVSCPKLMNRAYTCRAFRSAIRPGCSRLSSTIPAAISLNKIIFSYPRSLNGMLVTLMGKSWRSLENMPIARLVKILKFLTWIMIGS
jgi:hypothetical protein